MSFPDQDAGSGTSTLGPFNLVVAIHATASALIKFQIGEKGAFELVRYWVLERREIDSMTYWYTIRASVGTVAHERVRRAKRARFQNYFSIFN